MSSRPVTSQNSDPRPPEHRPPQGGAKPCDHAQPVAAEGHDRSGDNLSISIDDPHKYICWAGCTRDMIRAAMGLAEASPA